MTGERRWALITGAGHRIGAHLAQTLACHGYGLHLHTRTHDAAPLADRLERDHRTPTVLHRVDLTDRTAIRTWARELAAADHPPSLIVNNASPFPSPHALEDLGALDEGIAVHLIAPTLLYQALPEPQGGHVVHLLDARLGLWDGLRPGYELSKHALAAHTLVAARLLAPRIRVNALAPGLVLPPPGRDRTHLEHLAASRAPLRAPARLDDLTAALLFLDHAPSVTGQILHVDSGEHLGPPCDHARPIRLA
ncbi:SDR family oxidoreductase [Nocardiopsis sp. N85]|uniref:SDR family oxidoreductase n=1 Tax=Nocardiopsis sp. N85 TaxID=3029400 RepID=UPI00237F148D|nr:SDR family oxidoreductase [Nocardiopsis sp. N85]MDE3720122.1 SDR family oxidoreductase [Nocardiopsis sp. N85]